MNLPEIKTAIDDALVSLMRDIASDIRRIRVAVERQTHSPLSPKDARLLVVLQAHFGTLARGVTFHTGDLDAGPLRATIRDCGVRDAVALGRALGRIAKRTGALIVIGRDEAGVIWSPRNPDDADEGTSVPA